MQQPPLPTQPFRFGPWTVDPTRLDVTGPDGSRRLEPKIMNVLLVLVSRHPEVVTRQEILDSVWSDVIVGDDVLTRAVSELRRLFHDTPQNGHVIETIPSRGYRWVPPVQPISSAPHASSLPLRRPAFARATGALLILLLGITGYRVMGPAEQAGYTEQALSGRPFSTEPGTEADPAFSPDESMLAYAARPDRGTSWTIRTRDLATGMYTDIVSGSSPAVRRFPVWTPAGDSIAFAEMTEDSCRIAMTSVHGGPTRSVTRCTGRITGLSMSPDGSTLVFSEAVDAEGSGSVAVVSRRTGDRRNLMAEPGHGYRLPVHSPDGAMLAVARANVPGRFRPVLLKTDGSGMNVLTDTSFVINGLTWKPDGEALLFTSYGGTSYTMWEIRPGDSALRRVAQSAGTVSRPTFGPVSERMAFVDWSYDTNIRTGVDGPSRLVEASTFTDILPEWDPNGTRLAFVSARTGEPEVWVHDTEGGPPVRLTEGHTHFSGPLQWSPDGAFIGFSRLDPDSGLPRAHIVEVASGRVDAITAEGPSQSPFWVPGHDGPWFTSISGGEWFVHTPTGLRTDVPARMARWSGVGDTLLVVRPHSDGLWITTLDGSRTRRLPVHLDALRAHTGWTVREGTVLVSDRPRNASTPVVSTDMMASRVDTLWIPGIMQDNSGISMRTGPESVHYVLEDRRESTIMITLGSR